MEAPTWVTPTGIFTALFCATCAVSSSACAAPEPITDTRADKTAAATAAELRLDVKLRIELTLPDMQWVSLFPMAVCAQHPGRGIDSKTGGGVVSLCPANPIRPGW